MSPRPYVFFDVDDTLVQWKADWVQVFLGVATEAGASVTRSHVLDALNSAFESFYRDCIRKHSSLGDLREFWLDYDAQILSRLGVTRDPRGAAGRVIELLGRPGAIQLYPEVPGVLRALQRSGVRLGIVTGRPAAAPDLELLGVRRYFDLIIDAFHARSSKSEGRMFRLAAEAAAEQGRAAWHVGDSYRDDVQGARAAGLRAILVDRRNARPQADCPRVTDLRALLEMI